MQKSVLITGCSSGIGKCTAEYMRKRRWYVYATARKKSDVQSLRDFGFSAYHLDLTDSNSIHICAEQILNDSDGKLNAIVHNAGVLVIGAIEDISREGVREQFETNVFGPIELTQHLIPAWRAQGDGKIIFISSPNSNGFGYPLLGVEAASKAAIEVVASALRRETKGSRITISTICPGESHTGILLKAAASLLKYVDTAKSVHSQRYKRLVECFLRENTHSSRSDCSYIVRAIAAILEHNCPPRRVVIPFNTKLHYWAHTIIPEWIQDILLFRAMKRTYGIIWQKSSDKLPPKDL